jgi:hypothetical protein
MLKPALYDKGLSGAILKPGSSATVSNIHALPMQKSDRLRDRCNDTHEAGRAMEV